jgi:hypothetical protein
MTKNSAAQRRILLHNEEFCCTTEKRDVTASMIEVVHQGPIAIVTLRRPSVNAMNLELTEEIATVFQGLGRTDR